MVVAIGLAFITFKGHQLTRREQRRREFIVAGMAAVSFAIYAAAMPSFFVKITILTTAWGQWAAILAIGAALSMPAIAKALGVRKQSSGVSGANGRRMAGPAARRLAP